ncbi:MAG: hypothetical protein PHN59_06080, partial [Candidatus Omnitrophica bacterium]|nr:hypothetical protein [Candidatus Omnitrophota bacterium]
AVVSKLSHLRNLTADALALVSGRYHGFGKRKVIMTDSKSGKQAVGFIEEKRVKTISLKTLLAPYDCVDLIHADIQGAEGKVFSPAGNDIHRKVKRVHIGTHGPSLEKNLRDLFNSLRWKCLYDYPAKQQSLTPYGSIYFNDGVQVWLNQELYA